VKQNHLARLRDQARKGFRCHRVDGRHRRSKPGHPLQYLQLLVAKMHQTMVDVLRRQSLCKGSITLAYERSLSVFVVLQKVVQGYRHLRPKLTAIAMPGYSAMSNSVGAESMCDCGIAETLLKERLISEMYGMSLIEASVLSRRLRRRDGIWAGCAIDAGDGSAYRC